jgi:putative ABC transport system permease protein
MLKNYLKIAFRNIFRNKGISLINIAGLAIGITCGVLILLWVQDELSYDQFHENSDNIYRVNKKYEMGAEISYNRSTPFPLADAAKSGFAQIKDATKIFRRQILVKYNDIIFTENRVGFTDPSFFEIFSFHFVQGNSTTALLNPNSVIITEDMKKKYFKNVDPIGKIITIDNRTEYAVTGVIENIPENSDLRYDMFMSISADERNRSADDWGSQWLQTFVLLQEKAEYKNIEAKLSSLIKEHLPEEKISLVLQPLKNIHLYAINGEPEGMKYLYFFSVISLFILLIACINYMNLSTARSVKRSRETGIRKVMGAHKLQISRQFFGESILYTIIALGVSLILIELIQPFFNNLTGKNLVFEYTNYQMLSGLILITIFTGLVSGIYPALFISSFQPIKVLKGNSSQKGSGGVGFRKALVIIQFSLSIILIISTLIIYSQLDYIQNKEMGYNKENILYLSLNSEIREKFDPLKSVLLQNSDIINIAKTSELPTEINSIIRGITWEGKETDEGAAFGFASVDYDYFKTMNMQIVQGRAFSKHFPADSNNYIFNEMAINVMGMESPTGNQFALSEEDKGTIVGVVKNFHSLPLTYEIEPMIFLLLPDYQRYMLVKIKSDNIPGTIDKLESAWAQFSPGFPFEYHFLDEDFDMLYRDEIRSGKIFGYFVILAIFISCLGLFGLSSFTAEQRTKEIGVRKVLGATVSTILVILIKDFTKWVLYANLIAWPIAWFMMNNWLQNFAYKTEMALWVFLLAGSIALLIAIITVSSQAIKAAIANPVESLRYE